MIGGRSAVARIPGAAWHTYGTAFTGRFAVYAGVKAALQTFSRAAAVEWGADGIRVNTIQPRVATPAFEIWQQDHPDEAAASVRMIPVGRLADAEHDVGRAVVFLAGPDAAMISGTILPVDGGSSYLR